jgi:hypothetical protein
MPTRAGADAFCRGIVPDHDEWTARAMGVRSSKHARLHEHSPVHPSACAEHAPEFASQPVMPSPRNVRRQSRPIGCRYARRLPAEVPPGAARPPSRGGDEHLNSVARTIGLVAGGRLVHVMVWRRRAAGCYAGAPPCRRLHGRFACGRCSCACGVRSRIQFDPARRSVIVRDVGKGIAHRPRRADGARNAKEGGG